MGSVTVYLGKLRFGVVFCGLSGWLTSESTMMSDSQVKQELARIRQSTAVATRRWFARHPGRPYRWAVLAGSGAFTYYTHIDLIAGLFASYIISHDPDTEWEASKQTGKFLQELWFYEQNGALKDVAAYASDMLE